MNVLEQFLTEIRPVMPPKFKEKYSLALNYVRGERMGDPEINKAKFLFGYVFGLASMALEKTYGWTSIPKWKRQLLIPAAIEWHFRRRRAYAAQREKLIFVRDHWHQFNARVTDDVGSNDTGVDTRDVEGGPEESEVTP